MDFGGALSTGILIYLTIGMLIQIFTFPETVRLVQMHFGPLIPSVILVTVVYLVIIWPLLMIKAFHK